MKTLKKLATSVLLICIFAMTAFADGGSPPCAPPDPGTVNSPPCAGAQLIPEESSPQTNVVTSSNPIDEYVVSEVALDFVQSLLSIY
jgi:hypothetical protein